MGKFYVKTLALWVRLARLITQFARYSNAENRFTVGVPRQWWIYGGARILPEIHCNRSSCWKWWWCAPSRLVIDFFLCSLSLFFFTTFYELPLSCCRRKCVSVTIREFTATTTTKALLEVRRRSFTPAPHHSESSLFYSLSSSSGSGLSFPVVIFFSSPPLLLQEGLFFLLGCRSHRGQISSLFYRRKSNVKKRKKKPFAEAANMKIVAIASSRASLIHKWFTRVFALSDGNAEAENRSNRNSIVERRPTNYYFPISVFAPRLFVCCLFAPSLGNSLQVFVCSFCKIQIFLDGSVSGT